MGEPIKKNVYLFVCNNLADWEPAFAASMISDRYREIPKLHGYRIVTFGLTKEPVRSFGGLLIVPDISIGEIDFDSAAMLILPGSTIYEKEDPEALVPVVSGFVGRKIPVAAICGGTLFLAKHGFLDSVKHTSAGPGWLKTHAPHYRGEHLYVRAPSIADNSIITANPLGFVEFAANIMKALEVFPPDFIEELTTATKAGYLDVDAFGNAGAHQA